MYSEVHILYGTQTGTALEASISLYEECRKRGLPAVLSPLTTSILQSPSLVIFLVSTTGDGEPPTAIGRFWGELMSEGRQRLDGIEFTVFGLGDSGYQQFNIIARKLWVRMIQLGAQSFYRKGLGDDQHDFEYEGEFDPWLSGLWPELSKRLPSVSPQSSIPKPWNVYPVSSPCLQSSKRGHYEGTIIEKKRVTVGSPEVYLITIQTNAQYRAGDVCELYPENSPELISRLVNTLHLDLSQSIEVTVNPDSGLTACIGDYGSTGTVGDLLGKWMDLHKSPSRRNLAMLLPFLGDKTQAEKIELMTNKTTEGRSEYHRYITKEKRNFTEVLWDFNSISTLTLSDVLSICGLSAARSYSICSVPPSALTLLITIKQTTTPFRRLITGHGSQYIQRLNIGDNVRLDITRKDVIYAEDESHVIVIACGSGIAAFWGLLTERMDRGIAGNVLFFGCRDEGSWVFREEMQAYQKRGLLKLEVVFSRTQKEKRYVQHRIRECDTLVSEELLSYDAHIYLCGQAKSFPKDVESAVAFCLCSAFGFTEGESEEFLKERKRYGKFMVECW